MKKEKWITVLKGYTIILVVLGHLLQGLDKSGIIHDKSIFNYIDYVIYSFHMPLFFLISGYLYKRNENIKTLKAYKLFVCKKTLNLAIPYFIFSVVQILINILFASEVNKAYDFSTLINILVNPIPPFWFLYALLSIFIFIPILETLVGDVRILLLILLFLNLISLYINTPIYFVRAFTYWAFYFYMGSFIYKYVNLNLISKKFMVSISILFITDNVITYLFFNNKTNNLLNNINILTMALLGICFSLVILKYIILKNNILCKVNNIVGEYSFQIFLLHTIFAAAIRVILLKLKINNFVIHFILGGASGIGLSMIVGYVSYKSVVLNMVFSPVNTINRIKGLSKTDK